LRRGYDVLLEKPIAPTFEEVEGLRALAAELGRKVIVCHVLRYTPFYQTVKRLLGEGMVGEIVTVNANEGVVPFHQAHSFVRGKWAQAENSSPMILAKCCHDMDILRWLVDRPCERVASFGSLHHFKPSKAPDGAADRCFSCPVTDCLYDARKYLDEHRHYLGLVWEDYAEADADAITAWLRGGPWERCVYACDNDVVDHQVLALEFAGGVTATFTMTAFDTGRHIEIFGTTGQLRAGYFFGKQAGADILFTDHATGTTERIELDAEAAGGHGGGDQGLVDALYEEIQKPADAMTTSIEVSVDSHRMAFAAERSRVEGSVIWMEAE